MIPVAVCLLVLAADTPASFDVASIRPSQPGREAFDLVPGSVTVRNARLSTIIRWAYDVLDVQVTGPGWIGETRFDIAAKAGAPAREPELRAMMQQLLKDRFKLELHREKKELPSLILTVAKNGHKLKEVQEEGKPSFQTGRLNLTGKGATIKQLITFLSQQARQPILDQTGLSGRYDYFVDINEYITEEMRNRQGNGPPPEAATIIAQALQTQLGLRMDPKKVPLEILIVDSAEKTPTEN